jgi:hypothetical protein
MNLLNFDKMKFQINSLLILACMILATTGCEDMNDKHKAWLENGEIIYIGKIDSLYSFSGDERIMFRYWISDPRVKTLAVTWSLGKESLEIDVPAHLPGEYFDVYIGKNEKSIAEGSHTFQWIAKDNHSNRSVVFEHGADVYGPRYKSRLSNRPLLSARAEGTDVTMTWGGMIDDDEVGIIVNYTNTTGAPVVRHYTSEEVSSPIVLSDVKLTSPVTWQTLYLPEPTAIDTFSTDPEEVSVQSAVNVENKLSKSSLSWRW